MPVLAVIDSLTPTQTFLAVLIGLVAGVLGGMAGIGGSLVMIPALAVLLGYDDPQRSAHHAYMAGAMCVNVVVAIPATARHLRARAVRGDLFRWLLPSVALAMVGGVLLSNLFTGRILAKLLALFIAGYCINNVVKLARHTPEFTPDQERRSRPALVATGAVAGTFAGLLGLGGGVVMVPMLQVLSRVPLRQAIGTSAAVMCFTALVGASIKMSTLEHVGRGPLEAGVLALAMAPGAVVGSLVGASLTHALPINWVRAIVSAALSVAAARMAGLF